MYRLAKMRSITDGWTTAFCIRPNANGAMAKIIEPWP